MFLETDPYKVRISLPLLQRFSPSWVVSRGQFAQITLFSTYKIEKGGKKHVKLLLTIKYWIVSNTLMFICVTAPCCQTGSYSSTVAFLYVVDSAVSPILGWWFQYSKLKQQPPSCIYTLFFLMLLAFFLHLVLILQEILFSSVTIQSEY